MLKRIAVIVLLFFWISALSVTFAKAGGGGVTGGATEVTQLANNVELAAIFGKETAQLIEQIQQTITQINMLMDMVTNTMELPAKLIGQVTGMIKKVMGLYNQFQGILARLSNLDEEFYNKFYSALSAEESKWLTNYSEQYYEMSQEMEKKAQKTLESLKVSAEDINDSSGILEQLSNNASSAGGRNAIMKAGNELLSFMNGEMLKTRTMIAEQTELYLRYEERKRTMEDAATEIWRKDLEKWKDSTYTPAVHGW